MLAADIIILSLGEHRVVMLFKMRDDYESTPRSIILNMYFDTDVLVLSPAM